MTRDSSPRATPDNLAALHAMCRTGSGLREHGVLSGATFDEPRSRPDDSRHQGVNDTDWQDLVTTREGRRSARGTMTIPAPPWHFSGHDGALDPQVPAHQGEHNEEVLKELGYTDDQIVADTTSAHSSTTNPRRVVPTIRVGCPTPPPSATTLCRRPIPMNVAGPLPNARPHVPPLATTLIYGRNDAVSSTPSSLSRPTGRRVDRGHWQATHHIFATHATAITGSPPTCWPSGSMPRWSRTDELCLVHAQLVTVAAAGRPPWCRPVSSSGAAGPARRSPDRRRRRWAAGRDGDNE